MFPRSRWPQPPPHVAKKRATIVHDLVFRIYPETVNHTILQAQTARLERVATECDLVITDSEQTAADFAHYYPHFRGKIQTIYPGVVPLSFDPHTSLPADIYKNEFFLTSF
jgi:glycosyltransferase involved in cell wall biosynthesis